MSWVKWKSGKGAGRRKTPSGFFVKYRSSKTGRFVKFRRGVTYKFEIYRHVGKAEIKAITVRPKRKLREVSSLWIDGRTFLNIRIMQLTKGLKDFTIEEKLTLSMKYAYGPYAYFNDVEMLNVGNAINIYAAILFMKSVPDEDGNDKSVSIVRYRILLGANVSPKWLWDRRVDWENYVGRVVSAKSAQWLHEAPYISDIKFLGIIGYHSFVFLKKIIK